MANQTESWQEQVELCREGKRNVFIATGTALKLPDGETYIVENDYYVAGDGHVVMNLHPQSVCEGRHCVIHNPSEHSMRDWPTHFRDPREPFSMSRGLMERICPHGIGHPDPDSVRYFHEIGDESMGVHGCDGCCMVGQGFDSNTFT